MGVSYSVYHSTANELGVSYSVYHSTANEICGTYLEHHDSSIARKPYVAPPRLWVTPDNMVLNVIRDGHSSSCGKSASFGSFFLASPIRSCIKELTITLLQDLFPVKILVLKIRKWTSFQISKKPA